MDPIANVPPAYKSTEFWLTIIVSALGGVAASGHLDPGSQAVQIIGLIIPALNAIIYTLSRTSVKNTATKAAAQMRDEIAWRVGPPPIKPIDDVPTPRNARKGA